MGHPVIALWATPRTASTAFERMMLERGDVTVLNEPWSRFYYYGADGPSTRFDELLPDSDPDAVRARVAAAAEERTTFVKDMAYHPGPHLTAELLAGLRNSFIIRDPARALTSFAKRWPDFTWDEAGYEAQARAFELVAELTGETPPVIDSDELRAEPEAVVAAWCAAVDLPYLPEAMTWEPGLPPELDLWEDWYDGVAESPGFLPPSSSPPPDLSDPWVAEAVERAQPLYDRLFEVRLRP